MDALELYRKLAQTNRESASKAWDRVAELEAELKALKEEGRPRVIRNNTDPIVFNNEKELATDLYFLAENLITDHLTDSTSEEREKSVAERSEELFKLARRFEVVFAAPPPANKLDPILRELDIVLATRVKRDK